MFVITGGGRGIGKALALALAARGKSVLIIGRKESALMDVAAQSGLIDFLVADVSTPYDRQIICERLSEISSLEGLIHSAGTIEPIIPLNTIDESAWRQVMATNVEAPLFLTQQLLNKLSLGRVLYIGSGAAYFPAVGWSAYCVSKAALSMLTRCWQLECQQPIFASVMPGIIDTAMVDTIRNSKHMHPEKLDFFQRLKRNNQLLSPDTVALFLCWLLMDVEPSDYVSKEWDIYDRSHHASWLQTNHQVPDWSGL